MKRIPIKYKTEIHYALVDDEDFEWLSDLHWCLSGRPGNQYVRHTSGVICMHHAVLFIKQPKKHSAIQIDHIDHNPLNNQRHNLRLVSLGFNLLHRINYHLKNKSGYRGVFDFKNKTYFTRTYALKKKTIYFTPNPRWTAMARELEIRHKYEDNEACNFSPNEIVAASFFN